MLCFVCLQFDPPQTSAMLMPALWQFEAINGKLPYYSLIDWQYLYVFTTAFG